MIGVYIVEPRRLSQHAVDAYDCVWAFCLDRVLLRKYRLVFLRDRHAVKVHYLALIEVHLSSLKLPLYHTDLSDSLFIKLFDEFDAKFHEFLLWGGLFEGTALTGISTATASYSLLSDNLLPRVFLRLEASLYATLSAAKWLGCLRVHHIAALAEPIRNRALRNLRLFFEGSPWMQTCLHGKVRLRLDRLLLHISILLIACRLWISRELVLLVRSTL